jgi:integrase
MVLLELYEVARTTNGAEPEHYVFPFGGIDPTRPMRSWRTAWRSLRKAAGLEGLRTHDGRHTAITTMDEKGVPVNVIEAQIGQSKLLKDYLHHRRPALNAAAAALEPAFMSRTAADGREAELVN